MSREELKRLVIEEATNLKEYATKKELERLDFNYLDPNTPHRCIYGQITGNCFNERAIELLNKCTNPYSRGLFLPSKSTELDFDTISRDFSPIELYISLGLSNKRILIDFLKGDLETLTPEQL